MFKNFSVWKDKNHVHYPSVQEENYRFEIYKHNKHQIDEENSNYHKYTLSLNKFSDLTNDEFKRIYIGIIYNHKGKDGENKINDNPEETYLTQSYQLCAISKLFIISSRNKIIRVMLFKLGIYRHCNY